MDNLLVGICVKDTTGCSVENGGAESERSNHFKVMKDNFSK